MAGVKERLRKARTTVELLRGRKKKKIFYPRLNDKILDKQRNIADAEVKIAESDMRRLKRGRK